MKAGDIVYYYNEWDWSIIKAQIEKIYDTNKCSKNMTDVFTVADLHMLDIVAKYGNTRMRSPGHTIRALDDLYISAQAAYEAIETKRRGKIDNYCKEISTLEDLLAFPLIHNLCDSECTDYEAVEAYQISVKELTGIDLNQTIRNKW